MTVYFGNGYLDTAGIDLIQTSDEGNLLSLDIADYIAASDDITFLSDTSALEIIPHELILYLGEDQQLTLLTSDGTGIVYDVTDKAIWSVDDIYVGYFDSEVPGKFITKKIGTCIITADLYGVLTKQISVSIHNPLIIANSYDLIGGYQPTIKSYVNLLTSQYQNSNKAKKYLETFLDIVEDIRELSENMIYYFSFLRIMNYDSEFYQDNTLTVKEGFGYIFKEFDACVGAQLDMLGSLIGQERRVYFRQNDALSPPTAAVWYTLSDDDYRNLLKNKMMINTWDGKASTLQTKWSELYPGGIISIQDNQDMTVDIVISGTFSDVVVNLILNEYIIPRPQGVQYNIYYTDLPIFGFDRDDEYIAGFDIGHWA